MPVGWGELHPAVAAALRAHKIMFLTDVAGWLSDPADEGTLISSARVDEVERVLGEIQGGMRPKLSACVEAIRGGVGPALIVDGRLPHSILLELFTGRGRRAKIMP